MVYLQDQDVKEREEKREDDLLKFQAAHKLPCESIVI
jgi:hypothetical protein